MPPKLNKRLTPGRAAQLEAAIATVREHVDGLAQAYAAATPSRRPAILAENPVFASVLSKFQDLFTVNV